MAVAVKSRKAVRELLMALTSAQAKGSPTGKSRAEHLEELSPEIGDALAETVT
jgi:hypothetical protein